MLRAKMAEWEKRRRALPMVSKWLHMRVKRVAYLRERRCTVWAQAQRRGVLSRRRVDDLRVAAKAAKAAGKRGPRILDDGTIEVTPEGEA